MSERNRPVSQSQRSALITGGTRGIGLGIARALVRDGWDLLLTGQRSADDVSSVLRELNESGRVVEYVAGNIAERSDRDAIVEQARQRFGSVNALINNA